MIMRQNMLIRSPSHHGHASMSPDRNRWLASLQSPATTANDDEAIMSALASGQTPGDIRYAISSGICHHSGRRIEMPSLVDDGMASVSSSMPRFSHIADERLRARSRQSRVDKDASGAIAEEAHRQAFSFQYWHGAHWPAFSLSAI